MTVNLAPQPKRTSGEIEAIVNAEVARFSDGGLAESFRRFVVAPRHEPRIWDWAPGALEFPTWVVAESQRYNYGIVYSENGFGPQSPWGLVFSSERNFGADYCWYSSLETAFLDSRLVEEHREDGGEA